MHVAIIMDGNGRWAAQRGLPRPAGHKAGVRAVRSVVEAAARSAVDVLTLYAFSADNWSRPADEVANLMGLLELYLISETDRCVENGVRARIIGRRDRLSPALVRAVEKTERATAEGERLTLQLAVDYSAREAISGAARLAALRRDALKFEDCLADAVHAVRGASSVDLLIRTGGERRLSDFLLWECAYAELVFVETCWPDFDEKDFQAALEEFHRRERRYGRVPPIAAATALRQTG
jgi:undecaprenyl diphosphate synthase